MFGTNEEVCYVDNRSVEKESPHATFKPSDQVKALIDTEALPKSVAEPVTPAATSADPTNSNEEKAACLAKMITERFQKYQDSDKACIRT
jgi:hypothetical protein